MSSTTTPLTTMMTTTTTTTSRVFDLTTTITSSTMPPKTLVSVPHALYVCIGTNLLAHLLSLIVAILCLRNFGKGLTERVFNNPVDRLLRKWFSRT